MKSCFSECRYSQGICRNGVTSETNFIFETEFYSFSISLKQSAVASYSEVSLCLSVDSVLLLLHPVAKISDFDGKRIGPVIYDGFWIHLVLQPPLVIGGSLMQ